jgi:hypothetical protein
MVTYEAIRGDDRIQGSIEDIAAVIGKKPEYIHKMLCKNHGTRSGWKVRRLYRTQWVYVAENPNDDPVSGSMQEVADILGYTRRYILTLANTGRVSKGGWRVKKHITEVGYDRRDV